MQYIMFRFVKQKPYVHVTVLFVDTVNHSQSYIKRHYTDFTHEGQWSVKTATLSPVNDFHIITIFNGKYVLNGSVITFLST